jgi:hypothetical protein
MSARTYIDTKENKITHWAEETGPTGGKKDKLKQSNTEKSGSLKATA